MTDTIATFCASVGVATTSPAAWSLQDLQKISGALDDAQALVRDLIELQARPELYTGIGYSARQAKVYADTTPGNGALHLEPNRGPEPAIADGLTQADAIAADCGAFIPEQPANPIVRAADGVTLEPGWYTCVATEKSFDFEVTQKTQASLVDSGGKTWGWRYGRWGDMVTAVRRVSPAVPEPVAAAAPLVEPGVETVPWNAQGQCPHGRHSCGHCVDNARQVSKERDELRSKVAELDEEAKYERVGRRSSEQKIEELRATLTAAEGQRDEAKLAVRRRDTELADCRLSWRQQETRMLETIRELRAQLSARDAEIARLSGQATPPVKPDTLMAESKFISHHVFDPPLVLNEGDAISEVREPSTGPGLSPVQPSDA